MLKQQVQSQNELEFKPGDIGVMGEDVTEGVEGYAP